MTGWTDGTAPRKWDANSAAAWHKWFHIIEDGAQAPSDRMVELAALGPGRILDPPARHPGFANFGGFGEIAGCV